MANYPVSLFSRRRHSPLVSIFAKTIHYSFCLFPLFFSAKLLAFDALNTTESQKQQGQAENFSTAMNHSQNSYRPFLEAAGAKYFNQPSTAAGAYNLFIPLAQTADQLLFTDLRIFDRSGSQFEGNAHLGYRKLNLATQQLFGVYGSFDRKTTEAKNFFNQLTFGFEYWQDRFFIGGNAYKAIGVTKKPLPGLQVETTEAHSKQQIVFTDIYKQREERNLGGVDAEVGYAISDSLTGYAGGYYFAAADTHTVAGPRARVAYDYIKPTGRILGILDGVGIEIGAQHDKPRGSRGYIGVKLKVGLTDFDRTSNVQGFARHMVELVRRDEDSIIQETKTPRVIAIRVIPIMLQPINAALQTLELNALVSTGVENVQKSIWDRVNEWLFPNGNNQSELPVPLNSNFSALDSAVFNSTAFSSLGSNPKEENPSLTGMFMWTAIHGSLQAAISLFTGVVLGGFAGDCANGLASWQIEGWKADKYPGWDMRNYLFSTFKGALRGGATTAAVLLTASGAATTTLANFVPILGGIAIVTASSTTSIFIGAAVGGAIFYGVIPQLLSDISSSVLNYNRIILLKEDTASIAASDIDKYTIALQYKEGRLCAHHNNNGKLETHNFSPQNLQKSELKKLLQKVTIKKGGAYDEILGSSTNSNRKFIDAVESIATYIKPKPIKIAASTVSRSLFTGSGTDFKGKLLNDKLIAGVKLPILPASITKSLAHNNAWVKGLESGLIKNIIINYADDVSTAVINYANNVSTAVQKSLGIVAFESH